MKNDSTPQPNIMRPCMTCGKYMELRADSKQVFCSPECAASYRRCQVCGRWFLVQDGSDDYCSEECRKPPEVSGIIIDYTGKEFS